MGKRIPLETIYRPSKAVSMKRLNVAVTVSDALLKAAPAKKVIPYGTPEHLEHKRAVKREQMRRYRAKKAGKK